MSILPSKSRASTAHWFPGASMFVPLEYHEAHGIAGMPFSLLIKWVAVLKGWSLMCVLSHILPVPTMAKTRLLATNKHANILLPAINSKHRLGMLIWVTYNTVHCIYQTASESSIYSWFFSRRYYRRFDCFPDAIRINLLSKKGYDYHLQNQKIWNAKKMLHLDLEQFSAFDQNTSLCISKYLGGDHIIANHQ